MQIFEVHELGPPSSDVLEPPLSGRVKGGSMNGGGLLLLLASSDEADASSCAVVASSPEADMVASSEAAPAPLSVSLLSSEQVVHGAVPEPPASLLWVFTTGLNDERVALESSPCEAQPEAPRARRQVSPAKLATFQAIRFTWRMLTDPPAHGYVVPRPMSYHFRPSRPGRPCDDPMSKTSEQQGLPASHALHLVDLVSRWQVSDGELLADLGFRREDLVDPHLNLPLPVFAELIERARVLTGEPALGFYLGLQMSSSAHGYLGFAVMSAPTLRDALMLAVQYAPIRTTVLALGLEVTEKSAALAIDELVDLGTARDVVLLALLIGLWRIGNVLLGREVTTSRLDVTFPEPDYYVRFRHVNPPVRFAQPANRLVFDASLLDARLVSADPASLRLAQDQCERMLESVASRSPLVERVRRLVLRRDAGVRSFEELAAAMHVSPRTLRRRLAGARVSFSRLLEEARCDRARALLRSPDLSTKDVAERVGYSNVANFMRAFRRWTGRTPAAYRRESGAPG
jgi:AraC-like DNA-binding protein